MPKEAEELLQRIKQTLRKAHPNWSDERIDKYAYGSVQKYWKKKYGTPAFN